MPRGSVRSRVKFYEMLYNTGMYIPKALKHRIIRPSKKSNARGSKYNIGIVKNLLKQNNISHKDIPIVMSQPSKYGYKSRSRRKNRIATRGYVKNLIKNTMELKHHDVDDSVGIDEVNGLVVPLCRIAQGDQSGNREGLYINMKRIQIRMYATSNTNNASARVFKIDLIRDSKGQGVDPLITDIFESASPEDPLKHENTDRFQILKSYFFVLGNIAKDYFNVKTITLNRKLNGMKCHYLGTTAAEATTGAGQLYLCGRANTTDAAEGTLAYYSRLRYTD